MEKVQKKRIELLEELQTLVTDSIITDRPLLTTKVRRKNRRFKAMIKEIKEWLMEMTQEKEPNAK